MTYNEIVDPYLNSIGRHRNRDSASIEIIFPFIIMMKQNDIFREHILKAELSQSASQSRNAWERSYHLLSAPFWSCYYSDKQKRVLSEAGYAVCDLASAYAEYINVHTTIAKIAVMNVLMDDNRNLVEQELISDCYMCNALAKSAQEMHGMIYKTKRGQKSLNPYIEAIIRSSRDLGRSIGNSFIPITDKREKAIEDAIHILIRKTVGWLFDEAPKVLKEIEEEI